jgi:hypothetical protein
LQSRRLSKRVFVLLVILKKRFNKMRLPCFLVKKSETTSGMNIYAYRAKESMPHETHILTLNFAKAATMLVVENMPPASIVRLSLGFVCQDNAIKTASHRSLPGSLHEALLLSLTRLSTGLLSLCNVRTKSILVSALLPADTASWGETEDVQVLRRVDSPCLAGTLD